MRYTPLIIILSDNIFYFCLIIYREKRYKNDKKKKKTYRYINKPETATIIIGEKNNFYSI